MKTSRWVGMAAVAAAVAGGASLNLRAQDEPAAPVVAAAPLGLAAPGRVEPAGEEREIGARMPGLLVAVHVDENDVVEAGAVLAEIDRSDLEAERTAALATIELRKAERARLVNGARSQERQAAKARVAAAEASLALARKEHARIEPLAQTGVLTAAELDRALERVESATAQSSEASKQLALLQAATRSDDVKIADAQIAVAEARLEAIDAAIEKSYVRSPVAGTVLRRFRRQGETVGTQPPTVLFVVGDLSHRMVRAEVDEVDVARIHEGDRVEVVADAYPGQRYGGRVTRVGRRVGGKTVTTERPQERQDRKVLDAMIELDPGSELPVGLRVDVFVVD
ncbi:MAG: efflux RND transporter periplasmic adaptor subunit [Deltaproteobacteria bacterium]|nr:efflux RND transporter periplasmic adaptor subunit [Deltaproteobacteria bacterium]MBK8714399.1 efflux RND transporter periplasmic adaptor subunit [Deltaproteobacteria bacterium]MBP7289124.1 efflux RND transporter periplasmic adaptor subunit [Nannocystaceae bacterium]